MKKKELSVRVREIQPSGIRRIFDLACENPDGIDLSIGEPDFDIPDPIKEIGIDWIKKGFNSYVSTRGIPELRSKLTERLEESKVRFEDILVTAGATGGYFLAIRTIVSPGDEVLIPDPYFVAYTNVVIMCGGKPRLVDTYPDFMLKEEAILPLITERTKAIVINHPGNPTGVLYSRDELQLVESIARHYGLYIISDEVYDQFTYQAQPFLSMGNIAQDAIVISGFSKTAGMTGWRLGYVSGPKDVIDVMATFQQYSYVCANSIAQKAAVAALDFDITPYVERYRHRRDLVYDGLKDNFKIRKPEGAFFVFPEAPGRDAATFVNKAIAKNVFIIPGEVFSQKNTNFRISFAVPDEKIKLAVEILNTLANEE